MDYCLDMSIIKIDCGLSIFITYVFIIQLFGAYIAIDGVWAPAGALAVDAVVSDAASNFQIGELWNTWNFTGSLGWVRISNNDRLGHGVDFTGSIPSRTTIPTVDANTVSLWPLNEGYGSLAGL